MVRALITGVNGFVGSHLSEFLLEKDIEVHGLIRRRADFNNIKHIKDKIRFHIGDLTDQSSIMNALKNSEPDYIFHLAAMSYVPLSWTQPVETFNSNVIGQINLLESIRNYDVEEKIKIMIAGSSEEYGLVHPDETPIKETNPLRPQSPYGVSKVSQDLMAQQYVASYGMKIFISRAFNHTGIRRGENFVTSNFAKQVAEIEIGKKLFLEHGNLEAIRDFTNVKDIVKAYWLGLNSEDIKWGEPYNICSGIGYKISEIIEHLQDLSNVDLLLRADEKRMRPSDIPILIGSNNKFRKATDWNPEIDFNTTIQDLLAYWRERV